MTDTRPGPDAATAVTTPSEAGPSSPPRAQQPSSSSADASASPATSPKEQEDTGRPRRRRRLPIGRVNLGASGLNFLGFDNAKGDEKAAETTGGEEESSDPTFPEFDGDLPWSQRSWLYEIMPFRGMWYDVRRRLPYYASDWTEAFHPRNWWTVAQAVVRIYFINLMPALAYILDMNHRTHGAYGVNEVILASALAAIVFPIFSVQPLTFVGVTGLINLVNYTQYDIVVGYYGLDQMDYLRVQAWSLIWAAGFHFITAIFNISDFSRFITDMTSTTFGFYVGIVYIQKGIELLILEYEPAPLDNATGWLSVTIASLFVVSVYLVSAIGRTSYLPYHVRTFIASFAFAAGCIFWTGFSHFPKNSLERVPIERLPITRAFFPTMDRSWFIDFWNIEAKWAFVGAPLGFLITILFYFDHNVSSIMAQARQFPVKRPAGFHWDFFLLGITTLVSGFLGLPAPNGLVPQCPWHTEALSVFKQVKVPKGDEDEESSDLKGKSSRYAGKVRKQPVVPPREHVVNTRVVEQRVSHLLIGGLTLATMTRPFLVALGTMPRAVFAGIFILVGWGSIEGNIITTRTLAVFRDRSMAPADDPLNQVRRSKIALFVAIQWFFFAITFAISQTIAGIGFPVLITLLIPFRYWVVPKWFSPLELRILDAPTADANVVLASIGHESQRCTGQGVKIAEDTKIAGTEYYDDENRYSDSDDDDVQPYSIDDDEAAQRQHAERASSPKKAARVSSSAAHRRSGSVPAVQESPFGTTHTMTFREPAVAHLDAPADGKSRKNRRSIIGRILGRSQHGSEGSTAAAAPSSSTSAAANMPAVPTTKASEKLISGQPAARDTAEYEKEQKEVGKPSTITLSGAPAAREVSKDLSSSAGPVETKSGDKVEPAATSAPKADEPAVPAGALAAGGAAAGGAGLAAAAASQSKKEEPKEDKEEPKAATTEPASSGVAQNGAVAKEAAQPAPALPQTSAAPATASAAKPTVLAAAAPQTSSGADAAQGTKTAANDGKTTAEIAAAAGVAGGTAAAGLATAAGKKEASDVEKYEAQRQAAADTLAKAEERQKALKEEKKSKQSNSARVKEEKALEKKRAAEAKKQLKEAEKHKKEAEKESKRQAVLAVQKEKREREEAARAAQAQKVKDAEAAKKQKKEAEEAAKKQKKADEEAAKTRKKEEAAAAAAAATAAAAAEKAKKDKEAEDEKKRQEEEKKRKAETDKAVAASKKESDKAVAAAQADADKAHKEAEQAKKQQKDGEAKAQEAVDAAKTEEQHAKDAEEKKKAEEAAAAAAAASAAAALAEVEREKKKRQEAEEARLDAEKAQKEAEDKAKKDAEEKEKREAEEKQKKEAEEKARQEAEERRKKEEAEAAAAAAAALKKKEEEVAAAKAQLEEEHKARLEAEKKAQENAAALQAKLDEEHKAREEAEAAAAAAATAAAAKLEQEHKAREEAEKQGKEAAAAAAAKLEQEHAARVEAEKKAQEDAEKAKASLDEEHKAREKAEAEAKEEHQKRLDAEKEVKSVTSGGDEATSPKASREDEENDAELAGLAATAAAALGAHEAGKGAETPAEIDAKKADRMWRSAAGVEGVTPGEEVAGVAAAEKKTPSKDQHQDKDGSSGTGFLKRIFTTRRASTKSVHGANDTEAPVVPPLPTKQAGEDKSVQKKDISAPATPKDEERPASFIKTGGRKLFAAEPSLIATPSKSSTKDKGKSKAKDEVKSGDKELPQAPVDAATKKEAAEPAPAPAVDLEKPSSDAAAPATPTRKPSTSVKRSNSSKPANKGSASKAADAADSDAGTPAKRPADLSKQSRFSSIFTSGLGLSTGGYAAHQKKSANASSNGGSSDGGKAAAPATPPATAAATQSPASPRKSTASTRRSRDVAAASPPSTEAGAATEKKPKDDGLTREIEQDGQRFIEHINPRFANLGKDNSSSASPKSAKKGKKGGAGAAPAKSAPAVQWRS